ncbi:hypothetical protein ACTXT7_000494 [Hymenolepis weldensis]
MDQQSSYRLKDLCERANFEFCRCPTIFESGTENLSNYLAYLIVPLLIQCSTGGGVNAVNSARIYSHSPQFWQEVIKWVYVKRQYIEKGKTKIIAQVKPELKLQ